MQGHGRLLGLRSQHRCLGEPAGQHACMHAWRCSGHKCVPGAWRSDDADDGHEGGIGMRCEGLRVQAGGHAEAVDGALPHIGVSLRAACQQLWHRRAQVFGRAYTVSKQAPHEQRSAVSLLLQSITSAAPCVHRKPWKVPMDALLHALLAFLVLDSPGALQLHRGMQVLKLTWSPSSIP